MRKPFRILAAVLALIAVAEIAAILRTPSYEKELTEARAAYRLALAENARLTKEVHEWKSSEGN